MKKHYCRWPHSCLAVLLAAGIALAGPRAGAATIVVNSLEDADHGPGFLTTLRMAINRAADGDTITFQSGLSGTIHLSNELVIAQESLTILGPGADRLTLMGSTTNRIFTVLPGVELLSETKFTGFTIAGGVTEGPEGGGGILNYGTLTLVFCNISQNSAPRGGGIMSHGPLTLINSALVFNSAAYGTQSGGGFGGGIACDTEPIVLTNCTLSGNFCYDTSGNAEANPSGGAIASAVAGCLLVNCSVSGNAAYGVHVTSRPSGGGLSGSPLSLLPVRYTLWNTIVEGNHVFLDPALAPGGSGPDVDTAPVSLGHNFIGYLDSSLQSQMRSTDYYGTNPMYPYDALLDLNLRAGPMPFLHPSLLSWAVDNADPAVLNYLTFDQRGAPRPGDLGDDKLGVPDVGAIEISINRIDNPFVRFLSWVASHDGRWEQAMNWNNGAPGAASAMFVTNDGTKTILIDSLTSGSYSNTMTISNLVISSRNGSTNTLSMSDSGLRFPLKVKENFLLFRGAALNADNAALEVNCERPPSNDVYNGSSVVFDGPATFNRSALNVSNAYRVGVGNFTSGSLSLTDSTFLAYGLIVGNGHEATARFVNSTSILARSLYLAPVSGSATSRVDIVGGTFNAASDTNSEGAQLVFDRGVGEMSVSNAEVHFGETIIGQYGQGSRLTLNSGTMTLGRTFLGYNTNQFAPPADGLLTVAGGQMAMPELHIGVQGQGTVKLSGGTLANATVTLAEQPGSFGDLEIIGGTHRIASTLSVGNPDAGNATVNVFSGALLVTNAAHNSSLALDHGALTHHGGVFRADNIALNHAAILVTESNLVAGGVAGTTNSLRLGAHSSLQAHASFSLQSGGALNVDDSEFVVDSGRPPTTADNGSHVQLDGAAFVNRSLFNVSNAFLTTVGATAPGALALTNSTFDAHNLLVGSFFNGTAHFVNCTSHLGYVFGLANVGYPTGTVSILGGQFFATNTFFGPDENVVIFDRGNGQMTVSNANVHFGGTVIGNLGSGTLTVQSGSTMTLGKTYLGYNDPVYSRGTIQLSGGRMSLPELHAGVQGTGMVMIAGGVLSNALTLLGGSSGAFGSLNVAGGTNLVSSTLRVGAGGLGSVVLSSGLLAVTNSSHSALLVVSNGTVAITGGTLLVDILIVTNVNGHIVNTGGNVVYHQLVLDPNLDADGDGLPNGWEQAHGLNPLSSAGNDGAGGDLDHDGMSNLREYLAGTDPSDPSSSFRIVGFTLEGTNARISWMSVSNHNYAVLMGPLNPHGDQLCIPCLEIVSPILHSTIDGVNIHVFDVPTNPPTPGGVIMVDGPDLSACTNAQDDASLVPYFFGASGWPDQSNGGSGFRPWVLTSPGGNGGFFVGDSSKNGNGSSGNINTGTGITNNSWGMWVAHGSTNKALRPFLCPLAVSNRFQLTMDNGAIESGGRFGFQLRSSTSGTIRFEFYGSDSGYWRVDDKGTQDAMRLLTTDGLKIEFTLLPTGDGYSLTVTAPDGSQPTTYTGTLIGHGSIDTVILFDENTGGTGPDQANDVYFNSLKIRR